MSILDTLLFAAVLFAFQILLAAFLIAVFMRLRIVERDTRLREEYGKTPILEVTGAGEIGDTRWSMRPLCRMSLYDDFLVVAVRARRILVPYGQIASVEEDPNRPRTVRMQATVRDGESPTEIAFQCKTPDGLMASIEAKRTER